MDRVVLKTMLDLQIMGKERGITVVNLSGRNRGQARRPSVWDEFTTQSQKYSRPDVWSVERINAPFTRRANDRNEMC